MGMKDGIVTSCVAALLLVLATGCIGATAEEQDTEVTAAGVFCSSDAFTAYGYGPTYAECCADGRAKADQLCIDMTGQSCCSHRCYFVEDHCYVEAGVRAEP